jgi:hypothetical protein
LFIGIDCFWGCFCVSEKLPAWLLSGGVWVGLADGTLPGKLAALLLRRNRTDDPWFMRHGKKVEA